MIYKKAVVLSAADNSQKKAVLSLDAKAGVVRGEVKLYNFVEEPMGVLTLGFLIDGRVQKAGLSRTGYMQYHFTSILQKIPESCTCAIVSSLGGETKPILVGAIQSAKSLESVLLENLSVLKETSASAVQETLEKALGEYEDQEEIEEAIDEELEKTCPHNCAHCDYKKAFYAEEIVLPEEIKNDIIKGKMRVPDADESVHFIDEIGNQIQGLFDTFPRDEVLENIIPNSKWVKVDFNKDGKFYVVGLIYEDGQIKYVCYGVPGVWSETPPADFNEKAQWLPTSLDAPQGAGYWITYQDAFDGELVAVNII